MHSWKSSISMAAALFAALSAIIGCSNSRLSQTPGPDYARPLPPGSSALRRITDPARMPDLEAAARRLDPSLIEAMNESLIWFDAPSSRKAFPFEGISHRQARASVMAMREIAQAGFTPADFATEVRLKFDIYESVGYDGEGVVLYTGYYAPVFSASRTPTGEFRYPLYTRPDDLATDDATGEPLGRRLADGSTVPYFTRRQLEESGRLAGLELVWLESPFDVYIVHVNGSARLRLVDPDGSPAGVMHVGYAGKTDRPYRGLGSSLVEAGMVSQDELSLTAVKRIYRGDPMRVADLILDNESYVFFTEYDGGQWPAGSLGVRVTPERSLATDKKIYPRGGVVLVDTTAMTIGGRKQAFLQLMLDQDTGGAIQAPGRADLYMGVGEGAEILAGGQYAEGRLYYLILKAAYVDRY